MDHFTRRTEEVKIYLVSIVRFCLRTFELLITLPESRPLYVLADLLEQMPFRMSDAFMDLFGEF
jgi:hypothetical protein